MISVIIPFYNVEPYIEKCILSVKEQTYQDFECILVDDGSPDNSYALALKAIGNDSRFRIIRQQNKGLGGARNTGIEASKGEYITFLDSDDYLDNNFLEIAYEELVKNDADCVCCAFRRLDTEGNVLFESKPKKRLEIKEENIRHVLLNRPAAHKKLFKRKLWENIRFPEKLYFEDKATLYKLSPYIDRLLVTDKGGYYNYIVRSGSIMQSFSEKHINDLIHVHHDINKTLNKDVFSKDVIAYKLISFSLRTNSNSSHHRLIKSYIISSPRRILSGLVKDWKYKKIVLLYQLLPIKIFKFLVARKLIKL